MLSARFAELLCADLFASSDEAAEDFDTGASAVDSDERELGGTLAVLSGMSTSLLALYELGAFSISLIVKFSSEIMRSSSCVALIFAALPVLPALKDEVPLIGGRFT